MAERIGPKELEHLNGRVSRRCDVCGLTVHVTVPSRRMRSDSTDAWRHKYVSEIRPQFMWTAMCPQCRQFWNRVFDRIREHGPNAPNLDAMTDETLVIEPTQRYETLG